MPCSGEPHADARLPAVDARLVATETRFEIYDGALVYVSPADEPHGTRHSKISALLEAHVAADFRVASDMLTRTSRTSDLAPDVSVFPRARNRRTGGRQLEQLAFEVVSTESMSHARDKAARLAARGVRRVFAIDVERDRALEWSSSRATWRLLDPHSYIEDPTLAAPLPIRELVSAARADDAIVRAMIIKRNPVIQAVREEGKRQGLAQGKRQGLAQGKRQGLAQGKRKGLAEALLGILTARRVPLKPADRARIVGERDPERLRRWITRAVTCTDVAEVLGAPTTNRRTR